MAETADTAIPGLPEDERIKGLKDKDKKDKKPKSKKKAAKNANAKVKDLTAQDSDNAAETQDETKDYEFSDNDTEDTFSTSSPLLEEL